MKNGIVTRKSEHLVITMEELKDHNPELTPNFNSETENNPPKRDYMTARHETKNKLKTVKNRQKKAKDTSNSKVQKTFGIPKKSVQHIDSGSLSKSTKTNIKRTKIKSKINSSLIDYNSNKSVKKTGHYSSKSQLMRPQSAFK